MDENQYEQRIKDLELTISNLTSRSNVANLQKEMSFRTAIENSMSSGIAVVDDKGKQVYVNASFCKMLGWDEDELLGKYPPYVYWDQQDLENINNALRQTINNSAPKEGFDLTFRHKNGKLINVNVTISPFIQKKNNPYFLANVIDITDRKKKEEELKESQLLLTSSIESQKDTIIFSIDRNYHYLYFNKAHIDSMKFAYNADIKIGMNFLEYISSDDDRKLLKVNIDNAFKGESNSVIQTFGDSNIAFYEVFLNPIGNEKHKIIGCTILARNISERKHAEQELRDSETKLREIINQINDVIIVFDEQGKIIIWNKGAELLSGLKAEETLNRNVEDVLYELNPPSTKDKARIDNLIKGIVTQTTPEIFNQIIDSEILPVDSEKKRNIQSTVFPIALNGYHLFCSVIRDVTEVKRYEKELLRISSEKDKFYSVIAQYLYTPFSLFNNFAKLMAEELDTLPLKEIQKMAVMMSKSATNLYSLLDNMLQWTRINQGKIAYEPQRINLKKISQDAVSILKPHADAKNIKINHFAEDELTVYADIYMLKTIMRNLVSNAIEFTSHDGQINISAQQTQSNTTVSILNSGLELTPAYLANLFNISEIHTTLGKAEEKGTILGLLLCKEFVEKHSGKIWVESKNDGKASEFKFTLPTSDGPVRDLY
ncbi:MAG: PAS domain S-box protein [Bacteroidales bacterium]